jgi:hypothetical protein
MVAKSTIGFEQYHTLKEEEKMKGRFLKVSRLFSGVAVAVLLCLPAQVFALTVRTIDIVDGAVTAPKIADGAVTSTKIGASAVNAGNIADGAVTDPKLGTNAVTNTKIADGAITTAKIGAGAVGTGNIADGAVTDAKISGQISVSKIAGNIGVEKLGTYAGVKVVHKGAVDNVNTFNAVGSALQSIGSNTASRYAIIVMPGVYEEDFSLLNNVNNISPVYNVDIIGQSRTGSYLKAIGNPVRGSFGESSLHLASGVHLRNLSFEGTIEITYIDNASVTECNIKSNAGSSSNVGAPFYGHSPKNLIIENVNLDTETDGMWLYGLIENDTLVFNNININMRSGSNHAIWVYPVGNKPVKFSNVTIKGAGNNGLGFFSYDYYNPSYVDLVNFSIEGVVSNAILHHQGNSKVNVKDSKLIASVNTFASLGQGGSPEITVDNTVISDARSTIVPVKIGNSRINESVVPGTGLSKIVNCYTSNYDQISNGVY